MTWCYACDVCGHQFESEEVGLKKCPCCGSAYIFDYCFDCGEPLYYSMEENVDWFDVKGPSEAYAVCKDCYKKSGEASFRLPGNS